jgi:hypothetical protein
LFSIATPVRHELDVAELLRGDGRHEVIEGPELALGLEVEALEHVVPERGHLAVLAAQEFLERGGGVGVLLFGSGQLHLKLVDAKEHGAS